MKTAIDLNYAPEYQGQEVIYGHTVAKILRAMRTLVLEVSTIEEKKMMFPRFAKTACELTDEINKMHNAAIVREVIEKEKKGLLKSRTFRMTPDGFKEIS